MSDAYPQRIVCLTEEPTEVLYAIGEDHRIVGISGFTVRPPRARKEKPKVSAFTSAKIGQILDLKPDLAIGFSDLQADIAQELIRAGVEVWISNHRSVDGIVAYIRRLGAMVGATAKAEALAVRAEENLARIAALAAALPRRPKVYFEEWDDPLITGIRWVGNSCASPVATMSSPSCSKSRWRSSASWPIRSRWCGVRRISCSVRGAASASGRSMSRRVPAGATCRPCVTANCTRSSRRSSCNRGRRPSSMASKPCTR